MQTCTNSKCDRQVDNKLRKHAIWKIFWNREYWDLFKVNKQRARSLWVLCYSENMEVKSSETLSLSRTDTIISRSGSLHDASHLPSNSVVAKIIAVLIPSVLCLSCLCCARPACAVPVPSVLCLSRLCCVYAVPVLSVRCLCGVCAVSVLCLCALFLSRLCSPCPVCAMLVSSVLCLSGLCCACPICTMPVPSVLYLSCLCCACPVCAVPVTCPVCAVHVLSVLLPASSTLYSASLSCIRCDDSLLLNILFWPWCRFITVLPPTKIDNRSLTIIGSYYYLGCGLMMTWSGRTSRL